MVNERITNAVHLAVLESLKVAVIAFMSEFLILFRGL